MKLFVSLTLLAGVLVAGCASNNSGFSSVPGPSSGMAAAPAPSQPSEPVTTSQPTATEPAQAIVTPDNSLAGKVVTYNSVGQFVVLRFPAGQMPKGGQTLFVYRGGLKVGEVKISGEQRDNFIVADIASGDAQPGDDVRDQ